MEHPTNLNNQKITISSYTLRTAAAIGFTVMALSAFATSAKANLVFNGSFSTTTNGGGQLGYNTNAQYWTNDSDGQGGVGYNFIFASGTGDTTGSNGIDGNVALWGLNNGGIDTLPASSPDGGNYIGDDGAYEVGAIQQTITGLIVGDKYQLGFWWAGAQQSGFTGTTTEQWKVTLGTQTQSTAVVTDPSHGFTGWMYQTFTYTATSATEVLSFLAVGTPVNPSEPPFVLLDGVTLNQDPAVSEPGTRSFMLGGLGLIGLGAIRSKNRVRR